MSMAVNANLDLSPPGSNTEILSQGPEHCVASFAAINKMRANSQLCDIKLEVGEQTLDAHKVVLASASHFFYELFHGSMLEHSIGIVRILCMDVVTITHLIDYIYTGELSITEQNVRALLPASSLLQLHSVRDACCKLLLRQLHPSNCLNIMSFAETHSCKELHTACHKYILQHFQQVVETEEFLPLSFEKVRDIISNNLLNICSEETVFNAVLVWIKHDLDNRQKHIAELMSYVRLTLVNRNFLTNRVVAEPLIRDDTQCKELLIEAMKYQLMPEQQSLMVSQMTQECRPDGMKPYVFAVGGFVNRGLNQCEVYNPRSNAWFTIAPMLSARYAPAMTTLHNTLYVMGGYAGPTDLDTAESYNPLTNKWNYITPMGTKRCGLGAYAFDGLIYVCGGQYGASCLRSTECYNPLTSTWNSCPSMNTPRKWCGMGVLDNCIYCCGGEGFSNNWLSSVERFDPRIGRWYPVPSMTTQRNRPGVASCDGFLYCIGGGDDGISSSGERFNLRTNTWETIAAMHSSRRGHGLVEVEGSLYALGGCYRASDLNSVERYDIHLNKWTIVNTMVTNRDRLCAAVLDCFDLESGLV